MFKTKKIKLQGINEPAEFVKEANLVKGEVNLHRGVYCVDGKSLLGVMAIFEAVEPVIVEYPEKAEFFEEFLGQFEV